MPTRSDRRSRCDIRVMRCPSNHISPALKEQIVFPEIDYDRIDQIRGMDIVICTTATTDDDARALLKGFNMPLNA